MSTLFWICLWFYVGAIMSMWAMYSLREIPKVNFVGIIRTLLFGPLFLLAKLLDVTGDGLSRIDDYITDMRLRYDVRNPFYVINLYINSWKNSPDTLTGA